MERPIRAITTNSTEKFLKYNLFHSFVRRGTSVIVFTLIFLALGILNLCTDKIALGIVMLSCGILYAPVLYLSVRLRCRRKAGTPGEKKLEQEIIFDEDKLSCGKVREQNAAAAEDSGGEEITIRYDELLKAYDAREMFYLYLNASSAISIEKSSFEADGAERLSALLREKLGEKRYARIQWFN